MSIRGDLFNGSYVCDAPLVCNVGHPTPVCERPMTIDRNGPCGDNRNCKDGLWCDAKTCQPFRTEGQDCPSGVGCAPGLVCKKDLQAMRIYCASPESDGGTPDAGADASD